MMEFKSNTRVGGNKLKKSYLIIIAFTIGIIIGMLQYNLAIPVLNRPGHPYYHGIRGENKISLTINVDWGEKYIPPMIDILNNQNIKVTFFVTGNWTKKFPDLLKKMADEGHEIGNHGYSHQNPVKLSNENIIKLIKRNEKLIYNITGKKTNLFAPPSGAINDRVTRVASSINYETIMWSADTIDWQRPAPEIIVQRAINKIDDGGIILMHPTRPSLIALPEIIDKLKKRGFQFVTISQLIGLK